MGYRWLRWPRLSPGLASPDGTHAAGSPPECRLEAAVSEGRVGARAVSSWFLFSCGSDQLIRWRFPIRCGGAEQDGLLLLYGFFRGANKALFGGKSIRDLTGKGDTGIYRVSMSEAGETPRAKLERRRCTNYTNKYSV